MENKILSAYNRIYESYDLILKALDGNNPIGDVQDQLKSCANTVNNLLENFNHPHKFASTLCYIQEQIFKVQNVIKKKPVANNKCIIKTSNSKLDKIKDFIENCEVDVKGQGFDTIAGLQVTKVALTSTIILPFKQPQLYEGLKLRNCILLFGPPGTGKTKLAIATAAETNARFISITSSDILSHYVGQTEKIISGIFHYVKNSEMPTILFIDEIDAFCRSRSENEPDHIRRIKTELLCQISNFSQISNGYLICATNCPWQLDVAFRRRFQRQLYVSLPDRNDRYRLLKLYTKGTSLEDTEELWEEVLERTEGYSGSDIEHLVMQALIKPVEGLHYVKVWTAFNDGTYEPWLPDQISDPAVKDLKVCTIQDLPANSVRKPKAVVAHVMQALAESRRTVSRDDLKEFEIYTK